jgi:hypothetical protein
VRQRLNTNGGGLGGALVRRSGTAAWVELDGSMAGWVGTGGVDDCEQEDCICRILLRHFFPENDQERSPSFAALSGSVFWC